MYLRITLLVLPAQHRTHSIIGSLVTIRRNESLLKRDNKSRSAKKLHNSLREYNSKPRHPRPVFDAKDKILLTNL